jgi:hypothetical protein
MTIKKETRLDLEKKNISRKISAEIDRATLEKEARHKKIRIELAAIGVKAFRDNKLPEAIKAFRTYIRVLEETKGVGDGNLAPEHFDKSKDMHELLLISGVYWDLVKLYDKTRNKEHRKNFLHYMEKFIQFSRGMPYQPVCAETLRKYILAEKPFHKDDFKNAYRMLGGVLHCFVATALFDVIDEETLPNLQKFRDERLMKSSLGRVFVKIYYRIGPWIALPIWKLPNSVRGVLGKSLNTLTRFLM